MKKLLLTIAVALLSVTAINAQVLGTTEWNKTLTTVAAAEDATNGVMAIDDNGNLFVSGALTTTATFGSITLEPIAGDQYIVKYNATGAEQWATAIQGAATITAMDTDAEGNLYVAGTFKDLIYVCNAGTDTYEELSTGSADQEGGFIVKYNADGTVAYARQVVPTTNTAVAESFGYYDSPYFRINKIVAENGKLYASAIYTGDVYVGTDLALKGRYNFVWSFMYADLPAAVVFSLNAETMDSPALVAELRSKEDITTDLQYTVNSVNFTVDGGAIYVAFQGFGDFVAATTTNSTNVTFNVDGAGQNEHGIVLVKTGNVPNYFKVYNNVMTGITSDPYDRISTMDVVGDNIYVVGSYRGYNALDNTISTLNGETEVSTSDIYVASINSANLSTNWVVTTPDKNDEVNNQYESVVGAMIYPNEVRMVTAVKKVDGNAVVSTSNPLVSFTGEVSSLNTEQATAVAYNGDKAAFILNVATLSALYYGSLPVEELVNEETVEVINGEILKTNVWNSSISAVQATDANPVSPAAMDADGNLYVSGKQTQDFDFAGTTIGSLGVGAYVAKYDAAGNEKFAFALYGSIALTAMTTDAEGNLYVAGSFTDEAYITDIEGQTGDYETITGATGDWSMERPSSFLAKYDANGNLLSVNKFDAVAGYDPTAEYWGSMASVSIAKIVCEGEKVYVQFDYTGDVTIASITLEAVYADMFGWALMESLNTSVVSFDADMTNPAELAKVSLQSDGTAGLIETSSFAVNDEEVYLSAVGYGNITISSAVGSETVTFTFDQEGGNTEHGALVAKVGTGLQVAKFNNNPTTTSAMYNEIVGMDVYAGNIYIAGTFNETFAFANTTTAAGASDIFAVCLNASDLSTTWVAADAKDEGATNTYYEVATSMILYKGNVYVTGAVIDMNEDEVTENLNYNVSSEGNMSLGVARPAMATAYCDDYAALVNFTETTNVAYYSFEELVGIEESVVEGTSNITYSNGMYIFAEAVDAQIYDVQGRCIKAVKAATEIATEGLNKGVYILKAGSEVVKFVK